MYYLHIYSALGSIIAVGSDANDCLSKPPSSLELLHHNCKCKKFTGEITPEQEQDLNEKGWTDIPPDPEYMQPIPRLRFDEKKIDIFGDE